MMMKKLSNSILQMTLKTGLLALGLALSALPLGAQTADHTGDFVIEADTVGSEGPGDLTMEGDQLDLGTDSSGPTLGMQFLYDDASDSFLFRAYQPQAVFEWWDGLTDNPNDVLKMRLGSDSTLSLFSPTYTGTGSDGMIELKPVVNGGSSIEIDGMKVLTDGVTYSPENLFGTSWELISGSGTCNNGFNNVLIFGEGNQASAHGQVVVGKYNEAYYQDVLQVGNGNSLSDQSNAMSVTRDGDLIVGRDIVVHRNLAVAGKSKVLGPLLLSPSAGLSMGVFTNGEAAHSLVDEDAQAYIDAMNLVRATPLSNITSRKINDLVVYLKEQGLWDHACVLLFLEGNGSASLALGGWTTNSAAFNSTPIWDSAGGLNFDGTNKFLNLILPGLQNATAFTMLASVAPQQASAFNTTNAFKFHFGDWYQSKYIGIGAPTGTDDDETWCFAFSTPSGNTRITSSAYTWSAAEKFVEGVQLTTSGINVWKGHDTIALSSLQGLALTADLSPSAISFTSNNNLEIGRYNQNISFSGNLWGFQVYKAYLSVEQRDWLVDWLEAW